MPDHKAFDPNENEVERPSYHLLVLQPWQMLNRVIDEGLGIRLLDSKVFVRPADEALVSGQKDFDENNLGHEVVILFLSRDNYRLEPLDGWCNQTVTPATSWTIEIERRDGRLTSGRVQAFEAHPEGIAAKVRLSIYDRQHPPEISHSRQGMAKITIRYGGNRKTQKVARSA